MLKRQKIFLLLQSVLCIRLALLPAAAEIGIYRDVLGKAIKICTECVGLG